MFIKARRGAAMITSLFILVLLMGIATLIISRTVDETRHSRDDYGSVHTLSLARTGALVGQNMLASDDFEEDVLNVAMATTLGGNTSAWLFGNGSGAPSAKTVAQDMERFQEALQTQADNYLCTQQFQPDGFSGSISLQLFVTDTACGDTIPKEVRLPPGRYVDGAARSGTGDISNQAYALPFVLLSMGEQGDYQRNIAVQGEFVIEAGSFNFAKYAYFTNQDAEQNLWFNATTAIDGPVHTNSNFRVKQDPWFGGEVTSAACQHLNNDPAPISTDGNGDTSCDTVTPGAFLDSSAIIPPENMQTAQEPTLNGVSPKFSKGVNWSSSYIALPENNTDHRSTSQGKTSSGQQLNERGLYFNLTNGSFPNNQIQALRLYAADADGNPLLASGFSTNSGLSFSNGPAAFQHIEVCPNLPTVSVNDPANCFQFRVSESPGGLKIEANYAVTPTPNNALFFPSGFLGILPITFDPDLDGWTDVFGFSATDPDLNAQPGKGRPFNGLIFADKSSSQSYQNGVQSKDAILRLTGPQRGAGISSDAGDPRNAPPALAQFSQLTISSNDGNIRITGDLTYERPFRVGVTAKDSSGNVNVATTLSTNEDVPNVLGIYSQDGYIKIGHGNTDDAWDANGSLNAPDNVAVHASIMSGTQQITVENYDNGVASGQFRLLGGMIQKTRGAFNRFNGSGVTTSGYSRTYTYDGRFLKGLAPPFFPTAGTEVPKIRVILTFGQKEQVQLR